MKETKAGPSLGLRLLLSSLLVLILTGTCLGSPRQNQAESRQGRWQYFRGFFHIEGSLEYRRLDESRSALRVGMPPGMPMGVRTLHLLFDGDSNLAWTDPPLPTFLAEMALSSLMNIVSARVWDALLMGDGLECHVSQSNSRLERGWTMLEGVLGGGELRMRLSGSRPLDMHWQNPVQTLDIRWRRGDRRRPDMVDVRPAAGGRLRLILDKPHCGKGGPGFLLFEE